MSLNGDFKFVNEIPESLGLSSKKILDFIKSVSKKCPLMRAFMLIKDKKTVAEGYFKPFDYKTDFGGSTLRSAAKRILSGESADGFEAVRSDDRETVFVFISGEPVSGEFKNDIIKELSFIECGKDTFDRSDIEAYEKLLLYLSALKTPLPGTDKEEETEIETGGKTYFFSENDRKTEWVRLSWGDKTIALRYKDLSGENEVYIGRGAYRKFSFAPASADGFAAGYWKNKNRFVAVIDFIGSRTGGMELWFDFDGDKLKLSAQSSASGSSFVLEGAAVK